MKKLFLLILPLAGWLFTLGQPGAPVSGFGTNGRVTTKITLPGWPNERCFARAVAVQADGKVVVAGDVGDFWSKKLVVARYTTTGALDATFNGDGNNDGIIDVGSGYDRLSVVIQTDGKILVSGNSTIYRLTSNGAPDYTFNNSNSYASMSFTVHALALQKDGKIIAAGYTTAGNNDFAVARLNTNGLLDNTFDGDGVRTTAIGASTSDIANAVTLQNDGKIVVAGTSASRFAVVRYTTAGAPDATFDSDGIVTTDISGTDEANAVAMYPGGKIVVSGSANDGGTLFATVRYNSNGSLDTGFDGDGIVTTTNLSGPSIAHGVQTQSDGKIVIGGRAIGSYSYDFTLVRYTANGALDATFGTDGMAQMNFGNTGDVPFGMHLAGNRVYLVGWIEVAGDDYRFGVGAFQTEVAQYILPVKLEGFSAKKQGSDAILHWSTSAQINTSHFVVERSLDGNGFTPLGTVNAAGNSVNVQQYTYADRNMVTANVPMVYYRLKMVDLDGKYSYSATLPLRLNGKTDELTLLPNPVKSNTTLVITTNSSQVVNYQITSTGGKIVRTGKANLMTGTNSLPLSLTELPAGKYVLHIKGSAINKSTSFIKL